mmetsp:Transcript_17818/g.43608  ORF Transcript_17818/g.43608 Transcript_17818/m.43608 type:complete len:349 (+) Transcript_17818:206-1252(+)
MLVPTFARSYAQTSQTAPPSLTLLAFTPPSMARLLRALSAIAKKLQQPLPLPLRLPSRAANQGPALRVSRRALARLQLNPCSRLDQSPAWLTSPRWRPSPSAPPIASSSPRALSQAAGAPKQHGPATNNTSYPRANTCVSFVDLPPSRIFSAPRPPTPSSSPSSRTRQLHTSATNPVPCPRPNATTLGRCGNRQWTLSSTASSSAKLGTPCTSPPCPKTRASCAANGSSKTRNSRAPRHASQRGVTSALRKIRTTSTRRLRQLRKSAFFSRLRTSSTTPSTSWTSARASFKATLCARPASTLCTRPSRPTLPRGPSGASTSPCTASPSLPRPGVRRSAPSCTTTASRP